MSSLEPKKDKHTDHLSLKLLPEIGIGDNVETVLVLGGQKSDLTCSKAVYAYIFKEKRWAQLANMPYKAAGLRATTCGDFVYICGAANDKGLALKSAFKFNTEDNTWTKVPDLPVGLAFHGMIACNGFIYSIGGSCAPKNYTSKIYRFEQGKEKWDFVGKMSIGMDDPEVLTIDQKLLYVVSGRCTVGGIVSRIGLIDSFNLESGKLKDSIVFPIKFPHRPLVWAPNANVLNVESHKECLEVNLKTRKVTRSSRTIPLMPENYKLNGCQAVCKIGNNKVFVCGGAILLGNDRKTPLLINRNAYVYDLGSGVWEILTPPPLALDCAACCKVNVALKFL